MEGASREAFGSASRDGTAGDAWLTLPRVRRAEMAHRGSPLGATILQSARDSSGCVRPNDALFPRPCDKSPGVVAIGTSGLGSASWSGGDATTTADGHALLQVGVRGDARPVHSESRTL